MKDRLAGSISKYALVLGLFYAVSLAFSKGLTYYEPSEPTRTQELLLLQAPYLFGLILNLITAYLVAIDIKRHQVKTKFVILATVLYRPVGVVAFLLFLLLKLNELDANSKG